MAKKLSEGRKAGSGRKPGTAKTLAEGRKVGSGRKKGSGGKTVGKTLADGRKVGSGRKKGSKSNTTKAATAAAAAAAAAANVSGKATDPSVTGNGMEDTNLTTSNDSSLISAVSDQNANHLTPNLANNQNVVPSQEYLLTQQLQQAQNFQNFNRQIAHLNHMGQIQYDPQHHHLQQHHQHQHHQHQLQQHQLQQHHPQQHHHNMQPAQYPTLGNFHGQTPMPHHVMNGHPDASNRIPSDVKYNDMKLIMNDFNNGKGTIENTILPYNNRTRQ